MPGPDDVRIGDFSRSTVDLPKTESPTKERLDKLDNQLEAEASKDEAALKPMASYEEKLKEAGLTKDKAAEIIDAVLLKGFYAEDIKVTSKIKVRLRTRNARDTKRAQEMLEAQRFTIDSHYTEMWSRVLLAASLEQFGEDKFVHPSVRKDSFEIVEKAFQDRIAYVESLPDPALRVLFGKLWKFDNRVSVALEEGSIENF